MLQSQQLRAEGSPILCTNLTFSTPSQSNLSQLKWRGKVGGGVPRGEEGSAGTLNTDSPLARGGQEVNIAQILSSQKKKKMARNRKRESCQLEAG